MPGLMEEIGRRHRVSAYSPARPLYRQPGRTATAGTAQQILGGGFVANPAPQTSTFGTLGARPQPLPTTPVVPQQQSEPGGWRGLLADVAGSPLGRVAMSGLEVLGAPQRAIASTINEVADAFNGGDASFGDWWEQTSDPTFGMRDVIGSPTGVSWLDSTIGFGLDIATDPLTYIGGAGIYAGMGRRARTELAARIGASSLEDAAGLAAKVGRYGPSALSDAERILINNAGAAPRELLRSGYYFKLPGVMPERVRIPGTSALDLGIGRTFGRARAGIAGALPAPIRNISNRGPEAVRQAVTKLVTGQGDISVGHAAAVIEGHKAGDVAAGGIERFRSQYDVLARREGPEAMAAMRRATEEGADTPLAALYREMGTEYQRHGGYLEQLGNYQPHLPTPEARAFFDSDIGQQVKQALFRDVDLDAAGAHTFQRQLKPRAEPYKIAGRDFYVRGKGTADDLNTEFRRVFPNTTFDLYETDPTTIFNRYADSLKKDVHLLGMTNRLTTAGAVRRNSQLAGDTDPLVRDLVNQARGSGVANPDALTQWDTKLAAGTEATKNAREFAGSQIANLQGSFGPETHALLNETLTLKAPVKAELNRLLAEETRLAAQAGVPSLRGVRFQAPGLLEQRLNTTLSQLDSRFVELQREMAAGEAAAAADLAKWNAMRASGRMPSAVDYPALSAQRRRAAEAAQTSLDYNKLEAIRARAAEQHSLGDTAALNPDDDSFVGQVTGVRSGPVGGKPPVAPTPAPVTHPARSPQAIRTTTSGQRSVLAAAHPHLERLENRIASKAFDVAAAERRLVDVADAHHDVIAGARNHLADVRRVEADIVARIEELRGVPASAAERRQLQAELVDLRSERGGLGEAQAAYDRVRAPVGEARRETIVRRDQYAALQHQQEVAARSLPGTTAATFDAAPLARAEATRNNFIRSKAGKAERSLAVTIDRSGRQLDTLNRQLPQVAGARFEVDALGNVHPRFDTPGVARLVEQRDTLVNHELAEATSDLELAAARLDDVTSRRQQPRQRARRLPPCRSQRRPHPVERRRVEPRDRPHRRQQRAR